MGCCQAVHGGVAIEEMMGPMPSLPVVVNRSGVVTEQYHVDSILGEGQFGSVRRATQKSTGATRAIKVVPKKPKFRTKGKGMQNSKNEIEIMKGMDHPCIIKLFETYEDKEWIHLVMELCHGGDLFGRIVEVGRLTEPQAARVCQQMFTAIRYVHGRNVCHRDLKPENFLFLTRDPIERNTLKLTDFGVSCVVSGPDEVMHEKIGTPFYVAPQVLLGSYTQACDNWSAGVIVYSLLSGYPPFYADSIEQVLTKVKAGKFTFPKKKMGHVSHDAKELIRSLLTMEQDKRLTAAQALEHPWIQGLAAHSTEAALPENLVSNLRAFRSQNMLKKAALHVIAAQLCEAQISDLRKVFLALDYNGDGRLGVNELSEILRADSHQAVGKEISKEMSQQMSQEVSKQVSEIVEGADICGSGSVAYTDFLAASLERRLYLQEDLCWYAFNVFDQNGDGIISRDELEAVFRGWSFGEKTEKLTDEDGIDSWISHADTNGDGGVDFSEFMDMLRSGPASRDEVEVLSPSTSSSPLSI